MRRKGAPGLSALGNCSWGHQSASLFSGWQKCWALTRTCCAKAAIKLWQTDKSRSIHSSGWHHFFSSYWSITSQSSGTGERVEEKGSTETHQDMAITAQVGTQAVPPLLLCFSAALTLQVCVWERVGEAPGDTHKPGVLVIPQTRRKHEPAEETPGRSRVTGNPRARFLRRLGSEGPLCSEPPQALVTLRAINTFPCMSVPEDLSHVRFLFFPTIPKEGNHSYKTGSLLLSWHVHPLMLLFSLCSNFG